MQYSPEYTATTKRGSEQLQLSSLDNSEPKKARVTEPAPSKVVHVRNLPIDVSEQDLIQLASPFGRIINLVLLKGKNQAFIQLEDKMKAIQLINYYAANETNLRGKTVYFQFSNKDELSNSSFQNVPNSPKTTEESPNAILLVTIHNLVYPVTIEILYQIFSKFGNVLKILIFQKNGGFQSFIQFTSPSEASTAKMTLDGKNIYNNCCTLHIQYSTLPNLSVKYNNDKSRDFTNPMLPPGPPPSSPTHTMLHQPGSPLTMMPASPIAMQSSTYSTYPVMSTQPMYTGWVDSSGMPITAMSMAPMAPTTAVLSPGGYAYPSSPYAMSAPGVPGMAPNEPTVLIVSNLDTTRVTPDGLFTLFGAYGDVVRVKILFNKPDTALIQFVNSQHCKTALENLNGCPLYGKAIACNYSHHTTISMPRPGVDSEAAQKLTKDYSGSALHRFRVADSKNYMHICPPSATLHVSNISSTSSNVNDEQELRKIFEQHGRIDAFKFLSNKESQSRKKMALVQMAALNDAVEALVNLHNARYGDLNLRISFTTRKITA